MTASSPEVPMWREPEARYRSLQRFAVLPKSYVLSAEGSKFPECEPSVTNPVEAILKMTVDAPLRISKRSDAPAERIRNNPSSPAAVELLRMKSTFPDV